MSERVILCGQCGRTLLMCRCVRLCRTCRTPCPPGERYCSPECRHSDPERSER
jgi:hypothetical protein